MSDDFSKLPEYEDGARKIGTVRVPIQNVMSDVSPEERAVLEAHRTCGECVHFDYAAGQAEIKATRFLEALTSKQELGWQLRHLANPINHLGFCGQYNAGTKGESRLITAKLNRADECAGFKQNQGLVTLRRKTTDESP